MVDDELGLGMVACHLAEDGEFAGAHDVDGDVCFGTGGEDLVDAWIVGFDLDACEHDAGTDAARCGGPVFHLLLDGVGIGVERSDEAETSGVFVVDLEGVAGVVLVHGERGYEDGAVDTDRVHCRDHVIAGDFGRAFQVAVPGAFGVVSLVGVDLDVDYGGWGGHGCGALSEL